MLNERRADELNRMTKDELIAHIAELEGTMNIILDDWSSDRINVEMFITRMASVHLGNLRRLLGPNGRN